MKKAALAALAVALLAAGAVELGARALGYAAPFWYRPDRVLGWTLRPATEGWFIREGRSYVRVNAGGWRDRDRTLDKPAGTFRIVVLGDEQSEAMQVAMDDTWWSRLSSSLAACSGKPIEVLNFGVTGYGTAQELIALESVAMRYRPDLVLLQFSSGNDVQNNSFALAEEKDRPFYRLENGRLVVDDSFNGGAGFARHSSPMHEVARKMADRSRALQLASVISESGLVRTAHARAYQGALLAPQPRDGLWEEAWRVTEALLLETKEFSRRNGARFALVAFPDVAASLAGVNTFYSDHRITSFAERNGIPAIAIGPEMRSPSFYFETRLNVEGQRAAAELIARQLCDTRLLRE